jgi:hypothetical protein
MLTDNQKSQIETYAHEIIAGLRRQGAEYVAEQMSWPIEPIQILADAGLFDRAVEIEPDGSASINDMVLPLTLANQEVMTMQLQGQISKADAKAALAMIDDAIEASWPVEAKCDGPWQITLPDGTPITLTFMQTAWKKR